MGSYFVSNKFFLKFPLVKNSLSEGEYYVQPLPGYSFMDILDILVMHILNTTAKMLTTYSQKDLLATLLNFDSSLFLFSFYP